MKKKQADPDHYKNNLETSYLYGGNAAFVESLYESYLTYPSSVSQSWRDYFDTLKSTGLSKPEVIHSAIQETLVENVKRPKQLHLTPTSVLDSDAARKQAGVLRLIHVYRLLGHHRANIDPIRLRALPFIPDLDLHYHGLSEADLDTVFNTGSLVGPPEAKLRDIIKALQDTYTGHVATEYMHITDIEEKSWLRRRLEGTRARQDLTLEQRRHILERLTAAEGIETYLHKRYAGQKRFSLEGGEALIPLLDELIQRSGSDGAKEVVLAMAHRGRLNVLVNIMGKKPDVLFSEFEGKHDHRGRKGTGDVKYHQGFSSDVQTPGGPVHLALSFNPSHLEIVDPVAEGSTRARQDRRADNSRREVFPVLIHGDAAFAGQGVVYETMNLSQTRGYTTGGSIHIVVNNRIGFTTSHPLDTRSTLYCTDIGKVVQAPIFHVNGDDPEAVVFVAQLAWDFRLRFKKDVIIDLVCYRRHGHNEADEPAATQPMMYGKIRKSKTTREVYADRLDQTGDIPLNESTAIADNYRDALEDNRQVADNIIEDGSSYHPYASDWHPFIGASWTEPSQTAVPVAELKRLGAAACRHPEDFELHPRVQKVVDDRRKSMMGALPVDWGSGEALAYASLLKDGFGVRISGQDCRRGTFFHRHAMLVNHRNGESYVPLEHLYDGQPRFVIIDSILSEEAVLGFEYGYSATNPNCLVIWEAQYGDFANGAQVLVDQFISSSEQKWGMLSGIVMFLPHGWEGQGPEHSSARLERYLQLCAQENIQVCVPTSPAQMFHMLRRQMVRKFRRPLIVMTPKSMLRRKMSYSTLDELANGSFQNVIGEIDPIDAEKVDRIVVCSGKVYYDLYDAREQAQIDNIAMIRVEQLYPFPAEELQAELNKYPHAREIVWTQEEPQNQGAWFAIQHAIRSCMKQGQQLLYSGRTPSAAPAGGDYQRHLERQKRLVDVALRLEDDKAAPLPRYELFAQTTWGEISGSK